MSMSPTSMLLAFRAGTIAEPVTPCSITEMVSGLALLAFSRLTMNGVMAEWLAPVSSTRRNGPLPLIFTGAQMRPIRSRSVGATYTGSGASMITSERVSSGADAAGVGVGAGVAPGARVAVAGVRVAVAGAGVAAGAGVVLGDESSTAMARVASAPVSRQATPSSRR